MLPSALEVFVIKRTAVLIKCAVKVQSHFPPSTVVFSCQLQEGVDQVTLYSYKVQSTITSRMANTVIQTKVVNHSPEPQDVVFDIHIPKGAFISNFSM